MGIRCEWNGRVYDDVSDGIWDDGEFISWDSINSHLDDQELRVGFHPASTVELIRLFKEMVESAHQYRALTGRYLQIWGELGEMYAELKYGITRHKPMTQGSDGRMGNELVEVKTISPEKLSGKIEVKRAGNFSVLCVVKINQKFEFESRLIHRKLLGKGPGKHARYEWLPEPAQLAGPAL